jgi:hypothetical protein
MSILHSQLAIFGAIDELVLEARKGKRGADDQKVLKAAARLLPNSTGFGEAGWYRELTQFLGTPGVRNENRRGLFTFPSLEEATGELGRVPPPQTTPTGSDRDADKTSDRSQTSAVAAADTKRNPDRAGGFEDQTLYDSANDPALARASYGACVLHQLQQIVGADRSTDLHGVVDVAIRAFHPDSGDDFVRTSAGNLLERGDIATRGEWVAFVTDGLHLGAPFAASSLPCFGSLQEKDGKYCSTVVTNSFDPDLSVADIERVVEPVNWSICSKFFCAMNYGAPARNTAGWSRLSETIGAECQEYGLTTDLVFYKVRRADDNSIFINYDIDPGRNPNHPDSRDRGYVEVDSGYIWVSPENADHNNPAAPGVRIRTSKQEHVNGLSPCATAALACLMGWADAGREMLAGTARRLIKAEEQHKGFPILKPFYPSSAQDDPWET